LHVSFLAECGRLRQILNRSLRAAAPTVGTSGSQARFSSGSNPIRLR
jgi:hypothetical protein